MSPVTIKKANALLTEADRLLLEAKRLVATKGPHGQLAAVEIHNATFAIDDAIAYLDRAKKQPKRKAPCPKKPATASVKRPAA